MTVNLSTASFYDKSNRYLTDLRGQAARLQEQASTGKRLTTSSDDPVAAARLRSLSRGERLAQIDQNGANTAMAEMEQVGSSLDATAKIVIRAQELAQQAANGVLTPSQRTALGVEAADLRRSLLTIANGENGSGHALFGGQGAGAAYAEVGGVVTYQGSGASKPIDLGEGQTVTPSLTGPEVLSFTVNGTATDLFAVLGALSSALQGDGSDPVAASRNAMDGLSAGLERVTTAQAVIGSRMNWVELMDERRTTNGELRAQEAKDLGAADLATTISRLQEVMTVLEASQASFVRLANISLFDQLS
ncbi:flagellar hook protein FlgL [Croceibacterium mercuriale]|uniref:Flagellar hook protein FlgL n=1 Tax=Croceibacterium mercuriale TaxID=1572751 RepID=A0A0B2BVE8_9SPHN|nr:flagellar hook protein FlgL [Croceibacterium mercuriale]KHL25603.1 flagellar hook protein FlgL [Croceibacterium mercuriale]